MSEEFVPVDLYVKPVRKGWSIKRVLLVLGVLISLTIFVVTLGYWYVSNENQPPEYFPVNQPVVIEQGTEIREITQIMEQSGVVKSDVFLYYIIAFFHESTNIKASTYIFTEPLSAWEVALRLTEGDFDTDLVRFTHIEGERATAIAENADTVLPNFDADSFVSEAEPLEGRLFPDTYFIPNDYDGNQLLALMLDTFNEKIADLAEAISASSLTLDEILVLASIIEREANSPESMQMVSSVLQNRIKIGMPLQADASIEYVLDKPLSELTPEDLKIDSPYNTYLNTGLPPTPIGNPGLEAIKAVLEPAESEYLFYITGDDGKFYYAKTYAEHLRNIAKYL